MGGSSPHDVFKALGPAEWGKDVPIDAGPDSLRAFMNSTFAEAQCILDSIPVSTGLAATSATTTGRPRASTDSSTTALPGRAPQTSENAKTLRKDWKEVKVGPAENPLGMNVYKMSGKDGRGAWFTRRSLHEGLSFERWKLGMEREFAETMKLKKNPGSGNIRGIGAERCIENISVEGCGKAKVYQLSAQFPGPTTPRDFVTLMLTTDSAIETPAQARYFMVVSKPCIHPESPQRSGYIRGHYESVEFIREIKISKPLRRTQSSIDTTAAKEPNLAAEAAKAALSKNTAGPDSSASRPQTTPEDDGQDTMIEWLMITRSDPGGSVPRFMVERGTPSGICGDADKFLKWVSSKNLEDFDDVADARDGIEGAENDTRKLKEEAENAEATATMSKMSSADPTSNVLHEPTLQPKPKLSQNRNPPLPQRPGSSLAGSMNEDPSPQGFYGVIANAVGMVTSRLPNPFGSARGGDTDMSSLSAISSDISDDDDSSSILSFHSVEGEETNKTGDDLAGASSDSTKLGRVTTGASDAQLSINSTDSKAATAAVAASSSSARNRSTTQHEKDLLKLEQRQRKMEEKYARDLAKRAGDSTKDESAIAKLKEKHDRHKARQEDKYQRELRKLASRREAEQKKAERRKQKVIEKQEKSDLGMEMERIRAERDVARKQIEILKEQVGDLQSQNTLLVARLGREGITINPSKMQLAISGGLGASSGMVEGVFSDLSNGRRPVGASSGIEARGTKGGSLGSSSGGSSLGKKGVITNAADPGVQVDGPACMMREQPVVKGEA